MPSSTPLCVQTRNHAPLLRRLHSQTKREARRVVLICTCGRTLQAASAILLTKSLSLRDRFGLEKLSISLSFWDSIWQQSALLVSTAQSKIKWMDTVQ